MPIDEAIQMLEALAEEYTEQSLTILKQDGNPHAATFATGKANGFQEAAALMRIATRTTIPFEK